MIHERVKGRESKRGVWNGGERKKKWKKTAKERVCVFVECVWKGKRVGGY